MKVSVTALFLCLSLNSLVAETHHILPWVTHNDLFQSRIILNNLGNTSAEVTLRARRASGQSPDTETATLTLPPLGQQVRNAVDLFPTLGSGSGYAVIIESESSDVEASLVLSGKQSASGDSPAQASRLASGDRAKILLFQFMTVGADEDPAAPVLVNPNNRTANVSLYAYQNGAQVAQTERQIEPERPLAEVTTSLFPGLTGELFVVAKSDEPILGVAFVFNSLLEPALTNATAISHLPTVEPASNPQRPYVETTLASGLSVDGFRVDDEGNLYGAGGWLNSELFHLKPDGTIETISNVFGGPVHVLLDNTNGDIYVSSFLSGTVRIVNNQGQVRTLARGLNAPVGMDFDLDGNIVVCIYGNPSFDNRIMRITPDGQLSTLVQDPLLVAPIDIYTNEDGSYYVANQGNGGILHISPEGEVRELGLIPNGLGHAVYFEGNLYITSGPRIYRMTPQGELSVFAGSHINGSTDGSLTEATFSQVNGIAVGPDRTLWVGQATAGQPTSSLRRIYME